MNFSDFCSYVDRHKRRDRKSIFHSWVISGSIAESWFNSLVLRKGIITFGDFPDYFQDDILPLLTSDEDRQYFQKCVMDIFYAEKALAKDFLGDEEFDYALERLAECQNMLESFLSSAMNDSLCAYYARYYFSSFSENSLEIKSFFRKQDVIVSILSRLIDTVLQLSPELYFRLAKEIKIEGSQERLSIFLEVGNDNDFRPIDYVSSLVVCGSSAIGPRKSNIKKQDLDILFLPQVYKDVLTILNTLHITAVIDLLFTIIKVCLSDDDNKEYSFCIFEKANCIIPGFRNYITSLKSLGVSLDLFVPSNMILQERMILQTDTSWTKLVGPHRVAHTWGKKWRKGYDYFVNRAMSSVV